MLLFVLSCSAERVGFEAKITEESLGIPHRTNSRRLSAFPNSQPRSRKLSKTTQSLAPKSTTANHLPSITEDVEKQNIYSSTEHDSIHAEGDPNLEYPIRKQAKLEESKIVLQQISSSTGKRRYRKEVSTAVVNTAKRGG